MPDKEEFIKSAACRLFASEVLKPLADELKALRKLPTEQLCLFEQDTEFNQRLVDLMARLDELKSKSVGPV
jgi:hypothetical protein